MSVTYGSPVSRLRKFINFFRRGPKLAGTTLLLDRDGTINIDTGYISNPGEISLEAGALQGLDRLRREGVDFVVLSNQSGIGRGMFESSDLLLIHNRIDSLLQEEHPNLYIKRYFFCPHHPDDKCKCRKPKVGMYKSFLEAYPKSQVLAMVGDKLSDLRLLERYGIPAMLVRTGQGLETERKILSGEVQRPTNLAFIGDNLDRVARFIMSGALAQFAHALGAGELPEAYVESALAGTSGPGHHYKKISAVENPVQPSQPGPQHPQSSGNKAGQSVPSGAPSPSARVNQKHTKKQISQQAKESSSSLKSNQPAEITQPARTSGPAEPTPPDGTAHPAESTQPAGPAHPGKPTHPAGSTRPEKPTPPVGSKRPEKPAQPAGSRPPTDSTLPADSDRSVDSAPPADSDRSADSAQPATSAQSAASAQSAVSAQSMDSAQSAASDRSAASAHSAQPAEKKESVHSNDPAKTNALPRNSNQTTQGKGAARDKDKNAPRGRAKGKKKAKAKRKPKSKDRQSAPSSKKGAKLSSKTGSRSDGKAGQKSSAKKKTRKKPATPSTPRGSQKKRTVKGRPGSSKKGKQ